MLLPGVTSVILPKIYHGGIGCAGCPAQCPRMIHLSKGRKTLLSKRNRLLKQLFEEEIIDASTYELAISEPLPDEPHPLPQIAPHLVTRFYQERNGLYTAQPSIKEYKPI